MPFRHSQYGWPPRTGQVHQAGQPVHGVATAPLADRVDMDAHVGGDRRVRVAFRGGEDDAGADGCGAPPVAP